MPDDVLAHQEGDDFAPVADHLEDAKTDYLAVFGKKPHHKWNEATIRAKIEESRHPVAPPPAPSLPEASAVTVLLLGDHVYLPEDPTAANWAAAQVTKRYEGIADGRRVRVACHPTLAAFLQERGQAEMLD